MDNGLLVSFLRNLASNTVCSVQVLLRLANLHWALNKTELQATPPTHSQAGPISISEMVAHMYCMCKVMGFLWAAPIKNHSRILFIVRM